MDYDYWFNIHWFEPTQLDIYGGQYAVRWDPNGCQVDDTKEVLSGPAPAPEQTVYSKDDIPF